MGAENGLQGAGEQLIARLFGSKETNKSSSGIKVELVNESFPAALEQTRQTTISANITDKNITLQFADNQEIQNYYNTIEGEKPSYNAFASAMHGYLKLQSQGIIKKSILTIVDYTKHRNEKRLYSIDFSQRPPKVLFYTHVGHGIGSGNGFATEFGNQSGSHESSLGFYQTPDTITPPRNPDKKRIGLRMIGLEPHLNDQADERGIFIHPAPVDRSEGCFTIPNNEDPNTIMETLKGGSILFAYYPDQEYYDKSQLVGEQVSKDLPA